MIAVLVLRLLVPFAITHAPCNMVTTDIPDSACHA